MGTDRLRTVQGSGSEARAGFRAGPVVALALLFALYGGAAADQEAGLLGAGHRSLIEVHLAYYGEPDDAALPGLEYALEELNWDARLAGYEYRIRAYPPREIISVRDPIPAALFAAADAESLRLLSLLNPQIPIFNLTEEYDDLRALCLENLFHVIPSARMRDDAIAQWQAIHPGAAARALAWHEGLEGEAGDLNRRFEQRQGQAMDEWAWSAWAALKIFGMAHLASTPGGGSSVLQYLRTRVSFDGKKGPRLSFRPNGQLRQALVVVDDAGFLGYTPAPGETEGEALDSLGFSHCPTRSPGDP